MMHRENIVTSMPIQWLLSGEPYVVYRTLVDLVGKQAHDEEVIAAQKAIPNNALIKRIFKKQNKHGYWGTANDIYKWFPRKDTTFWLLQVVADFGFTKEHRDINRACEYVFSTQHSSGGFGCGPPLKPYDCFTGILVESLAKLNYASDKRLKKAYSWLVKRQRLDGGFWCKNTGQLGGPREKEPSCAFATLFALGALVQHAKLKKSVVAQRSAEFLLQCWENRGTIKYAGHDSQIGTGWNRLKYPFTDYRILKYCDVLSQIESVRNDKRFIAIIHNELLPKQDSNGCFHAESMHECWSDFDFGQKELPSRWITLLVYRVVKRIMSM